MPRVSTKRLMGWMCGLALAAIALIAWTRFEHTAAQTGAAVFSSSQGCAIVIPRDAIEAERRAAELLRDTLAKSSGLGEGHFPITIEGGSGLRPGIFVGATNRGPNFMRKARSAPFDTDVGCRVADGNVVLRSERRDSCEIAASWFLQKFIGAQWFMPGPLGEVIPARAELILPAAKTIVRPAFISRDLGLGGREEEQVWYAQNRLERRFEYGHHLGVIFTAEDLRRTPEMAPLRYGRRYIPPRGEESWQPNLAHSASVDHAASAANRAFAEDPKRISFSLGENDSARFDASIETLQIVAPARFFRTRPDYSDLVFGFTNRVAERVARAHPDRYLPTYAYYWVENTPRFPVAKNVVPYLTADRAQWFDPEFAAEDKRLIERWTKSGAEIVGVYDYFYGAPFLVPRPILTAVKESIPFEHRAGVRAFYAETSPNWALDGPKAWLAAQLLWDPRQNPEALLDTYYRGFWAEAAEPMREFYELCDRAWVEQPRPGYCIKYFQDEHQALLFPARIRAGLRQTLDRARELARTSKIRARIAFVTAGWNAAEAFIDFYEAGDRFSRTAQLSDSTTLATDWLRFVEARNRFMQQNTLVREQHPLALAPQKVDIYLRNDASARATRALIGSELGHQFLQANASLRPAGATAHELARLFKEGRQVLTDPEWKKVRSKPLGSSADFEFLEVGGHWQASGEPAERRRIEWLDAEDGGRTAEDGRGRTEGGVQRTEGGGLIAKAPGTLNSQPSTLNSSSPLSTLNSQLSTPLSGSQPSTLNPQLSTPVSGSELSTLNSQLSTGAKRLRFAGCRQEFLVQWLPTKPGALYAAEIDVRAKVSPGNQTFLIVNFLDEKHQRVGGGQLDRLPADPTEQAVRLCVIARAPANARFVGLGVRVIHQVNDDFAEFSGASLRRLEE